MAAALLLRQGRAGALKTLLLEARVFRGLAATVPLSAESGKSEKGLPPTPRKQGAPKNGVEPQEGAELPARQTAAAPRAHPSAGSAGGGAHRLLSGKTLVEFPQKAPFPPRERRSDPAVTREGRRVTDGSSSSSSSSSSSDSESDEEGDRPGARPRGKNKGRGRPPTAAASTEEEARAQKPHTGVAHPPKKNGPPTKPWEGTGEAKAKATARKPEAGAELGRRHAAGKQVPGAVLGAVRSADADRGSQKPCDVRDVPSDHAEPGLSAPARAGAGPGGQLQAAPPGAQESHRQRAPGPSLKAASPPVGKEGVGGQATATGEVLEDREPAGSVKTVPVDGEDVCEEAGGVTEAASALAPRDAAQGPALAPAEPPDTATYKNLQHHDYTPYTFLDLNLDLSKFRMPQPSSGRESPRH